MGLPRGKVVTVLLVAKPQVRVLLGAEGANQRAESAAQLCR